MDNPDITARGVHLVGSIPADSAEHAMREATTRLGSRLRSLPDGETGERRNWIVHIIESLRAHPDLEVSHEGTWSDYEDQLNFRVRRGHRLRGETLDFGHVAAYRASLPVYQRVAREAGLDGVAFQAGIPGDLDMALFTLGPLGGFRHRSAFTDATVREITELHRQAGDTVVFQLEVPAELVFMAKMPGPLRPAMAAFLSKGVARLAERSPDGARFGIHLCVGDLGNKALGRMKDAAPLVTLANAIVKRWPQGRPLEYVHAPFAAGDDAAPLDEAFYRPLAKLRLPESVRFVAGFVHEDRDLDEHRQILSVIERHLGRRVDLATACGLGRRDAEAAYRTMDIAAELS
ncbi:MAG: hypothetical protein ACRDT4_10270 [Micromonosporaceae bacterium]